MTRALVLRFAAPLQSWSGYRVTPKQAATGPVPSKTGVAGMLAAFCGEKDPRAFLDDFDLEVRVDRTNRVAVDLQNAVGPVPGRESGLWERSWLLATPFAERPKKKDGVFVVTGGSQDSQVEREYLPHAEFLVAVTGTGSVVDAWYAAALDPVFMPCLGRMSAAPEFPFVLGVSDGVDVLAEAPSVRTCGPLEVYRVESSVPLPRLVDPPVVNSREEYLSWFTQNLLR